MSDRSLRHTLSSFALFAFLSLGTLLSAKTSPPLAPVFPDTTTVRGVRRVDDWAWLKNREHPALEGVLINEEKYARSQLKASGKIANHLYKEFKRAVPRSSQSHPSLRDGYYFFTRQDSHASYPRHYRIKDASGAREELLLDENKLAQGSKFFQLDQFSVSRDGSQLAYSVDREGSEVFSLWIKDLASGKSRPAGVDSLTQALWLADGKTLAVTLQNARYQTDRLCLYDVASGSLSTLYSEPDPASDLSLWFSADRSLIFVESSSKNENQTWYLDASDPVLMPLTPRRLGVQVYPDCLDGVFYALTNADAPDYELRCLPRGESPARPWRLAVEGVPGAPISSFQLFSQAIALSRRREGFDQIELYDPQTFALIRSISRPQPASLSLWTNPDPHASSLLYDCENELTPYSIIRHDFATGAETLVYTDQPAHAPDYSRYQIELRWVKAADGTSIPLRLISRRDLDPSIPHPLWLYAYGAYGDCKDPYFASTLFPLLDRGFIYAVAHVRGGGELGKAWYDGGRTTHKTNTFTDFVACLDYLVAEGLTDYRHLVIEGGSAGGLLIGAVVNLVPQKIRLAIADVPFVDVANTMLDPDLPLTVQEYEEWGDPNTEEGWRDIISYSPYDNVRPAGYPHILAISAWNDIRVGYWESLKWVQKLRANTSSANPIVWLLRWNEGHTGTNDRFQSLRNYAQIMAYAISLAGSE